MGQSFIDKIGHKADEFHPEKFKTDISRIGLILQQADELKFNFSRYKDVSADQLYMSCLCYLANNKWHTRAFDMTLYGCDYMPPEIKFRIFEKACKSSRYEPPKTLSEAFEKEYTREEVALYVEEVLKKAREEKISLLTKHASFDHSENEINGRRVLGFYKDESTFNEDILELSQEVLEKNKEKIIDWLCSENKEDLVLDHDFGRNIGHGIDLNFCKYNTQIARLIMQKDSENDRKQVNILGCIGKTFFPDILKGEMTMERIPSMHIVEENNNARYIRFPLYRTFALMKDSLYDRNDVQLRYSDVGILTMSITIPTGKINGSLSIFEEGLQIEFESSKANKIDYDFRHIEAYDYAFGTDYVNLFKELERCYEIQDKIGEKWFDSKITPEELPEVTFNFNGEER